MNLIITCARTIENQARQEINKILRELGDDEPKIAKTSMQGILTGTTQLDPLLVIKKIKEKIEQEPWAVRFCLRIIPIQADTTTEIESIKKEALNLVRNNIKKKDDTYRITIEKRNSDISSKEIISEIAKNITNKVSLNEPHWVLLVEILGDIAGISVLKSGDILGVEKLKRALSE